MCRQDNHPDKKHIGNLPINYMIYYKYGFFCCFHIYDIWRTKIILLQGKKMLNGTAYVLMQKNPCSFAPPNGTYRLVCDAQQHSCTVYTFTQQNHDRDEKGRTSAAGSQRLRIQSELFPRAKTLQHCTCHLLSWLQNHDVSQQA